MLPELSPGLLGQVDPTRVQQYARAHGWARNRRAREPLAVYEHPNLADLDLVVPLETQYRDYAVLIGDVVAVLAEAERRSPQDVVLDLLMPPSDMLRFGLEAPDVGAGSAPLTTAINLLAGCRKALMAAALDVLRPERRFHARLSGAEADQIVNSSRVATEAGSFVAVLICPVGDAPVLPIDPPSEPPLVRRVTTHLVRSAQQMVRCVRADRLDALVSPGEGEPVVSANLIEALLEMQPPEPRARLSVRPVWEASQPVTELSEQVELRADYRRPLEDVARALRPASGPAGATRLVGKIAKAERGAEADAYAEGEVEVAFVDGDEVQRAGFLLAGEDFRRACDALRDDQYVAVAGVIERRARQPHRLREARDFRVLAWTAAEGE